MLKRIISLTSFGIVAMTVPEAMASSPHFVGDQSCVESNNRLTCSGKVAGLGNDPVFVQLVVDAGCTNRGGNDPPGQFRSEPEQITPRGGQIRYSETIRVRCPDSMDAFFESPATLEIRDQNGNLIFSGDIAF